MRAPIKEPVAQGQDFLGKKTEATQEVMIKIHSIVHRRNLCCDPSQGLGGQLGDPGARAIQVV